MTTLCANCNQGRFTCALGDCVCDLMSVDCASSVPPQTPPMPMPIPKPQMVTKYLYITVPVAPPAPPQSQPASPFSFDLKPPIVTKPALPFSFDLKPPIVTKLTLKPAPSPAPKTDLLTDGAKLRAFLKKTDFSYAIGGKSYSDCVGSNNWGNTRTLNALRRLIVRELHKSDQILHATYNADVCPANRRRHDTLRTEVNKLAKCIVIWHFNGRLREFLRG